MMRRFHAWFTEEVPTARGWLYIAVGFGIIEAGRLIAWAI